MKSKIFVGYTTFFGFIGEVFVNGQNKDVWCESKTVINDLSMYTAGKSYSNIDTLSCYSFQHGKLLETAGDICANQQTPIQQLYCLCS